MTPTEAAFRTPLGDVAVDHDFLAALGQHVTLTPVRHDEEHSLEIQLPFLQATLGRFSLVPIMMGFSLTERGGEAYVAALADALATLSDERTLLIASTDLSHMDNYADVIATDRELVAASGCVRRGRTDRRIPRRAHPHVR